MKHVKNNIRSIVINVMFFVTILFTFPIIAEGNNLIENSSFEVGAGHGWGLKSNYQISGPINHIDFTTGYHGNASLKLEFSENENAQSIISKIYKLKPGQQYTASFYAKSDFSAGDINITLKNTFEIPYGPGDEIGPNLFRATNEWKRFSFTFTTNDSDKCSYQLKFAPAHQGVKGEYIWLDAIQLNEGNILPYSPMSSIEASLSSNHEGNVFFEDESILMKLKLYNGNSSSKDIVAYYDVYDYFNKKVKSGIINGNIPQQSVIEKNLDLNLNTDKRGAFRVIYWVGDNLGTMGEVNYTVLPRPKTLGIDESSIFGAHVPAQDYYLSLMQKVGVKWNRTLSTGKQFRWKLIEPSKGNFVWKDNEINMSAQYGMKILATIGSELLHVPEWAKDDNGDPKLSDWYDFVYSVVNHYKGLVDHWEIWNEPDTEGGLSGRANFYAQLLKTAYNAAKSADPDCTIVGMAAYYASYIDEVFNTIGDNYCDIVSTHRYPAVGFQHLEDYWAVISNHGNKSVWNSETGLKTDSFYQTYLWEDLWTSYAQPDAWGRSYLIRTDKLIWNFAHTIGRGMKKYFYYDARQTTALDFLISFSLFEWDQTLKPKTVAYSILAHLFDGSVGLGPLDLHPGVFAYLFMKDNTPLMILWVDDYNNMKSLNTSGLIKAYNVMGNELNLSNGLQFSHSPIYLKGQGLTQDQFIGSLSISDSTDTNQPNLSIVTFPTGIANSNNVLFRWFAIDDVSISTRWNRLSESILYSYKLEGYDSNWSDWVTTTSKIYVVPDGNYTFQLQAKDQAGNISNKAVSVTVNTVKPLPLSKIRRIN